MSSRSAQDVRTTTEILQKPLHIYDDVIAFCAQYPSAADLKVADDATAALITLNNFRTTKTERELQRHCVRCHANFADGENGPHSCAIPHVFFTDWDKIYGCSSEYCGHGVQVTKEGLTNDSHGLDRLRHCFEGYHTDDLKIVENLDSAGAYNGVSIVPCDRLASGKCIREETDSSVLIFTDGSAM